MSKNLRSLLVLSRHKNIKHTTNQYDKLFQNKKVSY